MMCGAKCFIVQFEKDGERKEKRIYARTPAKARRVMRKNTDVPIEIISVRQQRN